MTGKLSTVLSGKQEGFVIPTKKTSNICVQKHLEFAVSSFCDTLLFKQIKATS